MIKKKVDYFFFSEIKIIFFAFFLIIFNENVFDRVSTVFPDFEIIKNNTLSKFSFFLKFFIFFSFKSLKKKTLFLIFLLKKIIYGFCA